MKKLFVLIGLSLSLMGCNQSFVGEQPDNTPITNFDYLWQEVQDKYSYLAYKQLDWDSIYFKYRPLIRPDMSDEALFRQLEAMMNEMRDGHANLFAPFSFSRYYPLFLNRPENYDNRLVLEHYFLRYPDNYFVTGPFQHTILDTLGVKIGLLSYRSFSSSFSQAALQYVMEKMQGVDGLVLDLRSNGGGLLNNAWRLAGCFTDAERIAYYSRLKNGQAETDFGPEMAVKLVPQAANARFTGRLAVLTNRSTYSASSLFALSVRNLPLVRLIGDTTGGGLGVPHGGELPNGWSYRFSVSQSLSVETDNLGQRYNWEDGVPVHIAVDLDPALAAQGYDSMLERALLYIRDGN